MLGNNVKDGLERESGQEKQSVSLSKTNEGLNRTVAMGIDKNYHYLLTTLQFIKTSSHSLWR